MFNLPATNYPTTQRIVSGVVPVYPDDVVLNCNTSTSSVTIELAEIPADFFSTQYKLYVVDYSNNSSVNNITIVAGAGQTINGAPTMVISTNGGAVVFMISNNTSYVGLQTNSTTPVAGFISVTFLQLTNLINTNTVVVNGDYLLLDAFFGSNAVQTQVYLKGMATNEVSLSGQGIFFNADYQNTGNYTGITGFAGQLGLWSSALATPLNSVVIWNNEQYLNLTGLNTLNSPNTEPATWQLLVRQVNYGYIIEVDSVLYDIRTNYINNRIDVRGNQVEFRGFSMDLFKWGANNVRNNSVISQSTLSNCNCEIAGSFIGNVFQQGSTVFLGNTTDRCITQTFINNTFSNSNANFQTEAYEVLNNKISNTQLDCLITTVTGKLTANEIDLSTLNIVSCSSQIITNQFNGSNITIASNPGIIESNSILNTTLNISTVNGNTFTRNTISNSGINIGINNGDISGNILNNIQTLIITSNSGSIGKNIIEDCVLFAVNIVNTNVIRSNSITNCQTFEIDTNSGQIIFNSIKNASALTIGDSSSAISQNNFDSLQLTIGTNSGSGLQANTFINCSISIFDNQGTIAANSMTDTQFNITGANTNNFTRNQIDESNIGIINNNGFITDNVIKLTNANISNDGEILKNTLSNLPNFAINGNSVAGKYNSNIIENCPTVGVLLNEGDISNNSIINAQNFVVLTNNVGAEVTWNSANDNSNFAITTNSGSIRFNTLFGFSSLTVLDNTSTGIVQLVSSTNRSSFSVVTNNGLVGVTAKTNGVILNNSSSLSITTITTNGIIAGVTLDSSDIQIVNFDIQFVNCNIMSSEFKIVNTTNVLGWIIYLDCSGCVLGQSGSYNLTERLTGSCISGLSTVKFTLDCSDPLVYDLPTQTLRINLDIIGMGGNYVLSNAAGLTIAKINQCTTKWNTRFEPNNGTVIFQSVPIAGAAPLNIVSPNGAFNYNVVYRALGCDYIDLISLSPPNTVAAVSNAVILT